MGKGGGGGTERTGSCREPTVVIIQCCIFSEELLEPGTFPSATAVSEATLQGNCSDVWQGSQWERKRGGGVTPGGFWRKGGRWVD